MTRIQIQLPEDIYRRAKKLAEECEVSLAEFARRGLEYSLSVYAPHPAADWQPPKPRRLGSKGMNDAQFKEQAHRSAAEISLTQRN